MIRLISEAWDDEFNKDKKLSQVCNELGLYDTINILDFRTSELMKMYEFYKHAPHLIDNELFMEAVIILNNFERIF